MQAITPTGDSNPNDHTAAEILDALAGVAGARRWSFRYELLDSTGASVEYLDGVESCSIDQNWLADLSKRTAKIRLRDLGRINYLSDRIRPWVRLHLPPYGDRDYVQWAQGVFLLSSPKRTARPDGAVVRDVEAYDLLQVLAGDKPAARYTLAAGENPLTKVISLLGSLPNDLDDRLLVFAPVAKEWEPGTSKLRIINDLLSYMNYQSLAFSERGRAYSTRYVPPAQRTAEYTYATGQRGVILPDVDQELDLFDVANQWIMAVSEPDRAPLVSTYTNNDPSSPTSTVRRGRTITDFRNAGVDAPDQATLDGKVQRLAAEASQVYEVIEFQTGLMPIHGGNDVYQLTYPDLAVNAKFTEHSWSMELRAGAPMRHVARRAVSV